MWDSEGDSNALAEARARAQALRSNHSEVDQAFGQYHNGKASYQARTSPAKAAEPAPAPTYAPAPAVATPAYTPAPAVATPAYTPAPVATPAPSSSHSDAVARLKAQLQAEKEALAVAKAKKELESLHTQVAAASAAVAAPAPAPALAPAPVAVPTPAPASNGHVAPAAAPATSGNSELDRLRAQLAAEQAAAAQIQADLGNLQLEAARPPAQQQQEIDELAELERLLAQERASTLQIQQSLGTPGYSASTDSVVSNASSAGQVRYGSDGLPLAGRSQGMLSKEKKIALEKKVQDEQMKQREAKLQRQPSYLRSDWKPDYSKYRAVEDKGPMESGTLVQLSVSVQCRDLPQPPGTLKSTKRRHKPVVRVLQHGINVDKSERAPDLVNPHFSKVFRLDYVQDRNNRVTFCIDSVKKENYDRIDFEDRVGQADVDLKMLLENPYGEIVCKLTHPQKSEKNTALRRNNSTLILKAQQRSRYARRSSLA